MRPENLWGSSGKLLGFSHVARSFFSRILVRRGRPTSILRADRCELLFCSALSMNGDFCGTLRPFSAVQGVPHAPSASLRKAIVRSYLTLSPIHMQVGALICLIATAKEAQLRGRAGGAFVPETRANKRLRPRRSVASLTAIEISKISTASRHSARAGVRGS